VRLVSVVFSPSSLVWWWRSGLVLERYLFRIQVGTGFSWFLLVLPGKYRDFTRLCQDRVLSNLLCFVTQSSSHHWLSTIVRNHKVIKNHEPNCLITKKCFLKTAWNEHHYDRVSMFMMPDVRDLDLSWSPLLNTIVSTFRESPTNGVRTCGWRGGFSLSCCCEDHS